MRLVKTSKHTREADHVMSAPLCGKETKPKG